MCSPGAASAFRGSTGEMLPRLLGLGVRSGEGVSPGGSRQRGSRSALKWRRRAGGMGQPRPSPRPPPPGDTKRLLRPGAALFLNVGVLWGTVFGEVAALKALEAKRERVKDGD